MKKKIFSLLVAGIIISINASSQTIRDNIDKAIKDKDAKERSAKADVIIQQKTISDSTQIKIIPTKVGSKTEYANKIKQKRNRAKIKYRTSSK